MSNKYSDLSILIIDDRPDKLLALKTLLADLCSSIATADSGRQALKLLLEQDFALILLDVNMPGMDGFETASLIRQRKRSESTPIIFVTSYGDDMHMSQGYSLGAVDYILSPVVPDVLRTKVTVFLDLCRKTREVEKQAQHLQQRAAQLHKLTEASLTIHSAQSMDKILRVITDTARDVIGAHYATTVLTCDESWAKSKKMAAVSAEFAGRNGNFESLNGSDLHALWRAMDRCRRLTSYELIAHPAWKSLGPSLSPSFEPCGWLAAALVGRDGREIGLVQLSHKREGEFAPNDEALLVQLAQMASIAIENILNSEAREANRIKDEFLATLSHELRTPLTAMLGWTQLLRAGALDPAESAHGLEIIERNVLAQAKLIDDLLDVSRIITGKLRLSVRPMSLLSVIEAAIDVVRPAAAAKEIRLQTHLSPDASSITGDPDRLQQVVWNLLVNAIKFTPAGGCITVALARRNAKSQIEISDTGEGIDPDFLPHIFDRFRQADSSSRRSHGGLGLGLAIVRHVVELHGGSVAAESAGRNTGAKFIVKLPIASIVSPEHGTRADSGQNRAQPVLTAAVDLQGLQVLVVDDEADGREAIAKVLELRGANVRMASSVREARETLEDCVIDVLVSDIGLPGEDGYDFIQQLRSSAHERLRTIPALALTAFAREEDSLRALSAGFQQHASKPIEPAALAAIVADLAGRRPEPKVLSPPTPAAALSALLSEL